MARQLLAVCLVLVIGLAGVVPPLLYSQDSATPLQLAWQSAASDGFTAIAVFDFDHDGDDDLAIGRRNLPTQLWRNDGVDAGGQPVFTLIWSSTTARETVALAWAVTSGGALLLAEANYDDVSVIYRVTPVGGGVTVTVQFTTQSLFAQTIVWGDIDSDSEPDLLIGGELEPIYYYLGATIIAGGPDTPLVAVPGSFTASSLALADMDGDSQPDLVAGLRGAPTAIFPGVSSAPFFVDVPIWTDNAANTNTRAVLVADFDGNGRDDLFIASVRENSRLYLHQSDSPLTLALSWVTDQRINAIAAAAADYNSDGLPDVALSSEPRSDVIQTLPIGEHLLQNNGAGGFTLVATLANRATNLSSIAWGQLVGGSTPDLAVVRFGAPARIYRNELSGAVSVSVTGERAEPSLGALFFRQSAGSVALAAPILAGDRPLRADASGNANLTGYVNNGDAVAVLQPVGELRTFASSHAPIPIAADRPNVITATLTITQTGIVQFIETIAITGTHTYFSDLAMTLISPAGTVLKLVDRVCGDADGFALRVTDTALGITCPPTGGAVFRAVDPLDQLRGESIAGVWQLVIEDNFAFDGGALTAWSMSVLVNDSPLYYTNFAPGDPPVFSVLSDSAPNALSVSAANPLLLFDIDVSLEWDARNDSGYLAQLRTDLLRASELLYDWTNGQAALGRVRIFHNRERWNLADVRVYASNRLRPNSDRGGVVQQTTITTNGNGDEVVFYPGRVRIGATWNQYGASRGAIGEDWPRALAHELGHYLFFLSDNYIGFATVGGRKVLVGVEGCLGAMNNPYREEESEFHPFNLDWERFCANTLSQLETGRADWDTIVAFYPALAAHRPATLNEITGPNTLPANLTEVIDMPLAEPARTVRQSTFSLLLAFGGDEIRLQPDRSARGFLFADDDGNGITDRLIDLGAPVRDQLEARGARPGDRLCLFEPAVRRLGCVEAIVNGQTTLTVAERPDWQPDIRIEPLGGQRIRVTVRAEGISAPLRARLFPLDGQPSVIVTLPFSGEVAQADITAPAPFDQALLHLWVDEPAPRRETVTDVSLYYYPEDTPRTAGSESPVLSQRRPCNPRLQTCPNDAPASLDGQAMVYDLEGVFGPGDLLSFQAATRAPAPPPPWTEQVGSGYWLSGSSATNLTGFSINLSYDEASLPPGTAGGLSIFIYDPAEQSWREVPVYRRDRERRELAGDSAGAGLYTLLTTLRPSLGWNILAYPWAGETVPAAFSRLNADARHYRIVYGYDEAHNRWQRYDPTVPPAFAPLVNTLTSLAFGRGYWVFVTDAGPAGAASLAGAALQSALPQPPTTYYGYIAPLDTIAFSPGQTVEALINGTVCGSAQVQLIGGRPAYIIDVAASQPGSEGCGIAGRTVTFRVNGRDVRGSVIWGAPGAHRLDLNPTIWLPLLQRTPVCLVACAPSAP